MKNQRFEQLKSIVNLDYSNRHDVPQMYFTMKDLKWFIEKVENQEKEKLKAYHNGYQQGAFDEKMIWVNQEHEDFPTARIR